jgi:hypothetical protein
MKTPYFACAAVALTALRLTTGCAVEPGDPGAAPPAAVEGKGESDLKPAALFSGPTIKANVVNNVATITGASFSPGGQVFVGYYGWENGVWVQWGGGAWATASRTSCTRTSCLLGGSFTVSFYVQAPCNQEIMFRAYDDDTSVMATAPAADRCL